MSRSRKYITDTILVLTKDVVVRGSGFIINVLLTKFLNPFGFGVYSLFQTSGNGINNVLKLGGFETSTQLMVANPKNHENIFKLSSIICTPFIVRISIAIIGFLILALFPDWIANDLLGQPDILNYVLVPQFGIQGSAFGTLVSAFVISVSYVYISGYYKKLEFLEYLYSVIVIILLYLTFPISHVAITIIKVILLIYFLYSTILHVKKIIIVT